jgi:hypothetical protein
MQYIYDDECDCRDCRGGNNTSTSYEKNRDIFIRTWIKKYRTVELYGKLMDLNVKEMDFINSESPDYFRSLFFSAAVDKWNSVFFVRF